MALQTIGSFLSRPWGLLGLLALVPLVILYLVRPDPIEYELPTVQFLTEREGDAESDRLRDRLRRHLLLLLQALALIVLAIALAGPLAALPGLAAEDDTVIVVDTSASMGTEANGATRFDRAVDEAGDVSGGTTTLVTTAPEPEIRLASGTPEQATAVLDGLSLTHTEGGLADAISSAADVRDEPGTIVVVSDFADTSDWQTSVEAARAAGHEVDLRQFDGGGEDNVGIVDLSFSGMEVTATVTNTGETPQERTLTMGNQSTSFELTPGDVVEETFTIPPGGGELELDPGDSFPVDDVAHVSAPEDDAIDVLVVTNDENVYLTTALVAIDDVNVEVAQPPVSEASGFDVVVFGTVDPERLLEGTVEDARDTAASGGGVVIQSQSDLADVDYDGLLPIDPGEVGVRSDVRPTDSHRLVDGIEFLPVELYVNATLTDGELLAEARNGSPMLVTDSVDDGRLVYVGYVPGESNFNVHYQYPIFWREVIAFADGRQTADAMTFETGQEYTFTGESTVETPTGTVDERRLLLDRVGVYSTSNESVSASLLSPSESSLTPEPVEDTDVEVAGVSPVSLTPLFALCALLLGFLELGYLKYRGEL